MKTRTKLLAAAALSLPATLLALDSDQDGLDDSVETNTGTYVSPTDTGTDPDNPDSDGDGVGDWYEVATIDIDPAAPQPNAPNDPGIFTNVSYPLPAQDPVPTSTTKPVQVYILSGQSNMQGHGFLSPQGTPGTLLTITRDEHKFPNLLDGAGWSARNDVTYRGVITCLGDAALTPGQGVNTTRIGPELGFGQVMGHYHDAPVLIIKSSDGGKALGFEFLPPGSVQYDYGADTRAGYGDSPNAWPTGTTPTPVDNYGGYQWDQCFLDEADWAPPTGAAFPAETNVVDVLDNFGTEYPLWASQGFEIAGFVWWQGWNDGLSYTPAYAYRYEQNMAQFIREIRDYYEARYPSNISTDAPFVVATSAFGGWAPPAPTREAVIDGQLAVGNPTSYAEFDGNVKSVEARSYWRDQVDSPGSQGYHYNQNAETYMLVGDALARGMIDLLNTAADTSEPEISNLSPANGAEGVPNDLNLVMTFKEPIALGTTGFITLKNLTDSTQTQIPVTDASQVSATGFLLTINPATDLTVNKDYAIHIDDTVIKDLSNNFFPGISNDTTWAFEAVLPDTTAPPVPGFADGPTGISTSEITMTATAVVDPEGNGVEYYFTCTSGPGNDSGWQSSPTYTDSGLVPDTAFAYTVTARDDSSNLNESAPSAPAAASTLPVPTSTLTEGRFHILGSNNNPTSNQTHRVSVNGAYGGFQGQGNVGSSSVVVDEIFSGPIVDYAFYKEGSTANVVESYADGGGGLLTLGSYAARAGGNLGNNGNLKVWTTTDPGDPPFSSSANFTGNTGVGTFDNINGSIDVSGLTAGTIYFFYNAYRSRPVFDAAMKDTDGPGADVELPGFGDDDAANNGEHYVCSIDFVNDEGYDTIDWTLTSSIYNGAPHCGFKGIVVVTPSTDVTAPTPSPMTWETVPAAISESEITMTATEATDAGTDPAPVEYRFTNVTEGYDSGWIRSRTWNDTGLTASTGYDYTVEARDITPNRNTTAASTPAASATTLTPDLTAPATPSFTTAPTPLEPYEDSRITMTASVVTDPEGNGVEYYFTCTSGPGNDSGWQASNTYTDTGLPSSTAFQYTVKSRDNSINLNESDPSAAASVSTSGPATATLTEGVFHILGSQNAGGRDFDVSVFPGNTGFHGTGGAGGTVDEDFNNPIVDYRFFRERAANDNVAEAYASGTGIISDISTVGSFGNNSHADVWSATDPGAGFPPPTNPADFTNPTMIAGLNATGAVTGSVDISALTEGTLYFFYGAYRNRPNFDATIKDTDGPETSLPLISFGDGDSANNQELYVCSIHFTNPGGYDTIDYSFNSTNGTFMGVVVTSASAGGGNDFSDWISGFTLSDTSLQGDDDGDGQGNAVENILGTDPSAFSAGLAGSGWNSGTNEFTFTHPANANPADDLGAKYQWSTDLDTWTDDGAANGATTVTMTATPDTPGVGTTTVVAAVTGTIPDELYVRLLVSQL